MNQEKTAVIFRRWPKSEGGGVLALFPEIPSDTLGRLVLSYERIGQHGGADCAGCIARTKPATLAEPDTAALHAELTQRGYRLAVYRRRTKKHRLNLCRAAVRGFVGP